jgi:crossover junction endodeoxyribonuclease RusA
MSIVHAWTSEALLDIFVEGAPATQGSKRGFVRGGRVVLVDDNSAALHSWREAIADDARAAWRRRPRLTGPVALTLTFSLLRPASAPKRRRTWPTAARSGDLDKLARAVFDALTGVVFDDDAQVTEVIARKDWAQDGRVGVRSEVREPAPAVDRCQRCESLVRHGHEPDYDTAFLHLHGARP